MGAGCLTVEEIDFLFFFKYTKEGILECYGTRIAKYQCVLKLNTDPGSLH